MKKIVICFSVLLICLYFSPSFAQSPDLPQKSIEKIVDNIVRPYFVALKNGDIQTLKKLMTKNMYNQRKVLFEQNKDYPDFLRKIYRDANFIIKSASEDGNEILVNAVIKYTDGRQNPLKLYLTSEDNGSGNQTSYGGWKVSNNPGPR